MNKRTKILIADDHSLIRKGLRQVIEANTGFEIFEAENGKKALELIQQESPEIALLDIEMPEMSGYDVAVKANSEELSTHLVFLTMYKDETMFNKAMDIGIRGYVLKENTVAEITKCIDAVLDGNYYLSPAISDFLVKRNQGSNKPSGKGKEIQELTPTERKVLKQVAEMKTSQEIADSLFVSIKTVQNHRNNICNKLGLHGAHALLKYALDNSENIK